MNRYILNDYSFYLEWKCVTEQIGLMKDFMTCCPYCHNSIMCRKKNYTKRNDNIYIYIYIYIYNAGLKTNQLGLFDKPALGKCWTEHMLGYFDPAESD